MKGFWMQACFLFDPKMQIPTGSLISKRAALYPMCHTQDLPAPDGIQPSCFNCRWLSGSVEMMVALLFSSPNAGPRSRCPCKPKNVSSS